MIPFDLSMWDTHAQPSQPVNHFHWLKTYYTNKSSEILFKKVKKKTPSEANGPNINLNIYGSCQLSSCRSESMMIVHYSFELIEYGWKEEKENFISGNKLMSSFERVSHFWIHFKNKISKGVWWRVTGDWPVTSICVHLHIKWMIKLSSGSNEIHIVIHIRCHWRKSTSRKSVSWIEKGHSNSKRTNSVLYHSLSTCK